MSRKMPGRPRKIPSYCSHKSSGQAVVRIDGTDEYLGTYGSPESYEKYHRLIAERFPQGPNSVSQVAESLSALSNRGDLTIVELIAAFWPHVATYYVKKGRPTSEQNSLRPAAVEGTLRSRGVAPFRALGTGGGSRQNDRGGDNPKADQPARWANSTDVQVGRRQGVDSRGYLPSVNDPGRTPKGSVGGQRVRESQTRLGSTR